MWDKIINPKSKRAVSINGRLGKSILYKYCINLHGGSPPKDVKSLIIETYIDDYIADNTTEDEYVEPDITESVILDESDDELDDDFDAIMIETEQERITSFKDLIIDFIAKCRTSTVDYVPECNNNCVNGDAIYSLDKYKLVSDDEFTKNFSVEKLNSHLHLLRNKNYISKRVVSNDTKIIFVGDYHSSLHSLIQHIDNWILDGIIDEDYKIAENHIIVCTGDIIDRGPYGIELLYLFNLLIRCNEPGKIIITKGNHETLNIYQKYGFNDEIENQLNGINKHKIKQFIEVLPLAVFIKNIDNAKWYMFCHGGIDKSMYEPSIGNSEINNFLNLDLQPREHYVLEGNGIGYLWGDFSYSIEGPSMEDIDDKCIWNRSRTNDRNIDINICPSQYVQKVLDNNNIRSVISGHQDKTTFAFLYRNYVDCTNNGDALNNIYYKDNHQLCSRNENREGDYVYEMDSILCFVLSSAVISKFRREHHRNIGYTMSYGYLDLESNISTIKLRKSNFI